MNMKDKEPTENLEILPDHESGVRRLVSNAHSVPYYALHSLEEAKSLPDGVVILEGDDGGQIYVVCRASLVKCPEEVLGQLLRDLDDIAWPGNDPNMAKVLYERHPVGAGIAGGMGGAVVTKDIWIHDEFIKLRLDAVIREVISGRRQSIHGAA